MAVTFTGDYSTNNVSQWPVVQTKNYNSSGSGYTNSPAYSINIGSDATYGKAALFEVRAGDWPGFAGGERAEVQGGTPITGGDEGDVRFYHFATKFPVGFPTNHHDLGWAVTNQWHGNGEGAASVSPPVEWNCSTINGRWTLTLNRYNAGPAFINDPTVWDTPINAGVWHDVVMEIKWSASDAVGYVRLWWNGVRQTLTGGVTTYFSRTLVPGQVCYYKEGFYREAMANTVQIYHAGFKSATSQSDVLGVPAGAAAGTYTWSSTKTGKRTPKGTVNRTYTWAATAVGGRALNDTFTGSNATLLTAHTSDSGAAWLLGPGTTGAMSILANRVYASSGAPNMYASAAVNGASADYEVVGQLTIMSAIHNTGFGVLGRVSNSAQTYYQAFLYAFSGNFTLYLVRFVAGGYAELANIALPVQPTLGTTHEVKLRMVGTQIRAYYDGALLITVTNSEITAAGFAGITSAAATTTTGIHFDSITAGPVPPLQGAAAGTYGWSGYAAGPQSFVTRDAATGYLMLNGARYRFGGNNGEMWGLSESTTTYGETITSGLHTKNHTAIDAFFTAATSMNARVVRTFVCGLSVPGTFMPATVNTFVHSALEGLDYAISKCPASGIRLLAPLVDDYDYYYGGKFDWCTMSGVTPDGTASQFFTNATVIANFKAYINALLNHTNIYTGIKYKDDPVFLAWETGNELDGSSTAQQLLDWTADIAQYIKVTVGAQQLVMDGKWSILSGSTVPETHMNNPYIDLYTEHTYDQFRTPAHMANQAAICHNYGKAFVIGEYTYTGLNQVGAGVGWSNADMIAAVEGNANVDGDLFWMLHPQGNFHGGGFCMHAPGDDATMIGQVTAQKNHAIAMAGATLTNATAPAKSQLLVGPDVDAAKWTARSGANISGGQIVLPSAASGGSAYSSAIKYDLTESAIVVKLPTKNPGTGNSGCGMYVQSTTQAPMAASLIGFVIDGNTVKYRLNNGSINETTEAYNSSTHRWLRLRASADATVFTAYPHTTGTIYWDVSTDGVTWVNKRTLAPGIVPTSVYLILFNENWGSDGTSGTAVFDNFNETSRAGTGAGTYTWAGTAVGDTPAPHGAGGGAYTWSSGSSPSVPPDFGSVTSLAQGSTNPAAVPVPAGVVAGSLVMVGIYVEPSGQSITPPAGFTEAPDSPATVGGTQPHALHMYSKRATGADAGTYDFTMAGNTFRGAFAMRFTDCVGSGNPFDVTNSAVITTTTGTVTPAVIDTTTDANRLWVWVGTNFNGGNCTTIGGFTERLDPGGICIAVDTRPEPVALTSSGSLVGTWTTTGSHAAWLGALLPVPAAGGGATGKRNPKATAPSAYTWAGAATGKRTPKATAGSTYTWTATGTGKRVPKGTGTGTFTTDVSATGKRTPKGTVNRTYTWAATAVGDIPANDGTATGSYTWAATATGKRTPKGSSSPAYAWAAFVVGSNEGGGGGGGTYTWAGTATGKRIPTAGVSPTYAWSSAATGKKLDNAAATGTYTWAADATGVRGVLVIKTGTATGAYGWAAVPVVGAAPAVYLPPRTVVPLQVYPRKRQLGDGEVQTFKPAQRLAWETAEKIRHGP